MKKGEREAQIILEQLGVLFDLSYCDDNSAQSMPDLKTADGRYIEVTHTKHNNKIVTGGNAFSKLDTARRLSKMDEAGAAYTRHQKKDYETDASGHLTPEAMHQHQQDIKLIGSHFGMTADGKHTEFKCDFPTIEHSIDNILQEIVTDKGSKYTDGKTDLFVFVTEDEYRNFEYLLTTKDWNMAYTHFVSAISAAPFRTIFVCSWDFDSQEYTTSDSTLTKIEKQDDGSIVFIPMRY